MSLVLDPGAAVTLTAQQLEQGGEDFIGSFGAGHGKWQLTVSANRPVDVMSLLLSPTGHLTKPVAVTDSMIRAESGGYARTAGWRG